MFIIITSTIVVIIIIIINHYYCIVDYIEIDIDMDYKEKIKG